MATLLGRKLGMTRVYTEDGASVPVTVLELGPCVVTQVRTADKDGYEAVQVGWGDMKARNSTLRPLVSFQRCASRWMWVSTGNAGS